VLLQSNGEIRLQGDKTPVSPTFKDVIESQSLKFQPYSKYGSPNYFLPFNVLQGVINSDEWRKNGIPIKVLND
jgi:tRNA1(Val) A37 N6-methylase TrmN6